MLQKLTPGQVFDGHVCVVCAGVPSAGLSSPFFFIIDSKLLSNQEVKITVMRLHYDKQRNQPHANYSQMQAYALCAAVYICSNSS